ncbi:MAG: hypothetical protein GF330_14165, partial [Candidatus Eisenbacteria bacterium]|nr:hypothetical protein [Candidatus Eisenbacteria bacterium]
MKADRSNAPRNAIVEHRVVPLALVAILALLLVLLYRWQGGAGYPLDDSWIHLSFARNLAAGEGFGVNSGQTSTGSTSPL